MYGFRFRWLGLLAALVPLMCCGSSCVDMEAPGSEVQYLMPDEAMELIQAHAGSNDFMLMDVSMPWEYAEGHIQDAVNVCYPCPNFSDAIAALDKSKTYLVYCCTNHRSPLAAETMKTAGFSNIYTLSGGLIAWKNKGYPVVK